MNKFGKFLGRNSAETCLKMDYFGSKTQKNCQALWGAPLPEPLTSGSWRLRFQTPFILNDYRLENVQDLLTLKVLVDAYAGQILG